MMEIAATWVKKDTEELVQVRLNEQRFGVLRITGNVPNRTIPQLKRSPLFSETMNGQYFFKNLFMICVCRL